MSFYGVHGVCEGEKTACEDVEFRKRSRRVIVVFIVLIRSYVPVPDSKSLSISE